MLKRTVYTKTPSAKDIKREVVVLDAKKQKLGRISTEIASKLIGKHKVNYVSNIDVGDYVVVKNAASLDIGLKKMNTKVYTRYSGYQGGQTIVPFASVWDKDPSQVIKTAVKGMLPDNKLKRERLKRLLVFNTNEYKLPQEVNKLLK